MVILRFFLFILACLPAIIFSAEFLATVNSNQVNVGESITLTLTLKDASAKGQPSLNPLKSAFHISSQQQSANTMIMNGHVTSTTTWKIVLLPQNEGDFMIPMISIPTSKGTLSSESIAIKVNKASAAVSNASDSDKVVLTAEVNNQNPFKNEAVFYTIKLASKISLANVKIHKFTVDDAILEAVGEPKIHKKVIDGVRVDIIEFNYLITPLKAGSLKIPPALVQGETPIRLKPQGRSLFGDDFDPYMLLQGLEQLKSFTLATEGTAINVKPSMPDVTPWLPAKSLKIEEIWNDSQTLRVGEPITRGFKIVAEGVMANQLPNLSGNLGDDPHFKIYADKPEMNNEIKEGEIHSYRIETITLIPQQEGIHSLPDVSIAWWDVTRNEKVVARLPSRSLQISPSIQPVKESFSFIQENKVEPQMVPEVVTQRDPLLFVLLAFLGALLCGAIFWGIALQRKIARLMEKPSSKQVEKPIEKTIKPVVKTVVKPKAPAKDKHEKLPDLNPT